MPERANCLPMAQFVLLLLLLHLATADRLYDPYGLNDAESEQQPSPQPTVDPRAAQSAAYRTYYLILVRRLVSRISTDRGQGPLSLGDAWMPDDAKLRRLKAAAELAEPGVEDLQDSNELILALFDKLQPASDDGSGVGRWWRLLEANWLVLAVIAAAGVAAACWLVVRRISLWQLVLILFIFSFVVNYVRVYKLALAQRQHAVISLKCSQGQPLGLWKSIGLWLTSTVRLTPPKDDCLKQMEALAVDPFFDVTPLEVAGDLLGGIVVNRLIQLIKAFNLCYRYLIEGLPIWHSIIITAIALCVPVFALLLRCRYSLRLMYGFLHLGPDAVDGRYRQRLETMEAENRRLLKLVYSAPQPAPARALQRSASVVCSQRQGPDGRGDGPAEPAVLARTPPPPPRMRTSRSECNISVGAAAEHGPGTP